MKLTVFGATGGIGRLVVEQAFAQGHDVTTVARNPHALEGVRSLRADLGSSDPVVLLSAVEGADAVLSALGPRGKSEFGIASRGTHAIIEAMNAASVRRIVVVSAAPVSTVPSPGRPHPPKHDPGDGIFVRLLLGPVIRAIIKPHYLDLAIMEDELRASGLEWTVLRPPRLTNGALTRTYRTAVDQNLRGGLSVSRANVADEMLRLLAQPQTIGHTIGIAS
jgi:putative NADH-flavin reductase